MTRDRGTINWVRVFGGRAKVYRHGVVITRVPGTFGTLIGRRLYGLSRVIK